MSSIVVGSSMVESTPNVNKELFSILSSFPFEVVLVPLLRRLQASGRRELHRVFDFLLAFIVVIILVIISSICTIFPLFTPIVIIIVLHD